MLQFDFNRRSFLKIGSIGAASSVYGFSDNLFAQDLTGDKAVIWVWLGGGPAQFETFHAPTDNVPSEWQPVNGNNYCGSTNINLGANWAELSKHTDKLNVINSFSHGDSAHLQGTHFMMTGHYNSERTQTAASKMPSLGSLVSAVYGANDPENGMPCYVKQGKIEGEDASWLGGAYKPFDPSAKDNLTPRIDVSRFNERQSLLKGVDRLGTKITSESADSVGFYADQAFRVILGSAKNAFDTSKESDTTKALYGSTKANDIGEQLILARRLVENGTRFVTIHYGGWDMHSNISDGMKKRVPPIDRAVAGLLEDLWQRGMNKNVMVVVTGEFGRTKINANAGRDHWPAMTPLILAGGDYDSGRTIGEADKSYVPKTDKFGPLDLQATVFDHMLIDGKQQRTDMAGRPRYLLDGEAKVILS